MVMSNMPPRAIGHRQEKAQQFRTTTTNPHQRKLDETVTVPSTLFGKRPFRSDPRYQRIDMQSFVQSLVDADHVDQVLMSLTSKETNLDKLSQILQMRMEVGAGFDSFQLVILPLMQFLTSERVGRSPCGGLVRTIYRRVAAEALFFQRVIKCFEKHGLAMVDHGFFAKAVELFVDLLLQLCCKVPQMMEHDDAFYRIACRVKEVVENVDNTVAFSSRLEGQLGKLLDICFGFLPEEEQLREKETAETTMDRYRVHVKPLLRATRSADETTNLGPRHDNDHSDYKQIMIMPTDLETRAVEDPLLPLNPDCRWFELSKLLDFHFRGLREDLLAQLKRGIQWFLGGEGLFQFYHQQKKLAPPRSQNIPSLLVCNEVRFKKVSCHYRKGVSLEVSAAQPFTPETSGRRAHRPQKQWNKDERKDYWHRDRLTFGSLVALAVGINQELVKRQDKDLPDPGEVDAEEYPRLVELNCRCIYFGTVSDRNEHELTESRERLTIGLRFALHDLVPVLTALRDPSEDCFLIETSGLCFPPTQAVLKTLQRIEDEDPPLVQELYSVNKEQFTSIPQVFREIQQWNLCHLLKTEFLSTHQLLSVPANSFEELCERLKAYEQRGMLVLDGSQVVAFAAALTRSSCLIQGPPGTGKSYVGTKIVETLLKQSCWSQWAPIVCVCYTNHALDQFLEALVSSGACAPDDIVRVGSRSKSETMQQRNLTELRFSQLSSRDEHHAIGRIVAKCKTIEDESLTRLRLGDSDTGRRHFLDWLQDFFPDEYGAIVGHAKPSGNPNGFEQHDSLGKTPAKRWKSWVKGKTREGGFRPHSQAGHDRNRPLQTSQEEDVAASRLLNDCVRGMWDLSRHERQILERYWRRNFLDYTARLVATVIGEYEEHVEEFRGVVTAQSLRILRQAKVVGITTTGCAQNQELIRALDPKIVLCEEAGEVLEAHLLACITSGTQQLIQIGDHLQLRPSVNEYKLSVESRQGVNLDISLFERMVTARERFFNKNTALMHQHGALVTLQTQRRMRSTIADLVRYTLYPSLEDASDVLGYPDLRGFRDNVWFLDHNHFESADEVSYSNAFEAEFIVELIQYAVKQGYGVKEEAGADDIAVLTPYLGQLRLIRRLLDNRSIRVVLDERDEEQLLRLDDSEDVQAPVKSSVRQLGRMVKLSTVDNFQGNEATLVLISTVRCNESGRSGFLKTFNRVNVMLSRAKHGMIVLGSSSTIRKEGRAEMFLRVLDLLESRQMMGSDLVLKCHNHGKATCVASAKDIVVKASDGGCSMQCIARLPCGHVCSRLCHPDDLGHSAAKCCEPCTRIIDSCGHLCTRRCHEKCECDYVYPEYPRACSHLLKNVRCVAVANRLKAPCNELERVRMPACGHEATLKCSIVRESTGRRLQDWNLTELTDFSVLCNHECSGIREECEHLCKKSCGQCLQHLVTQHPPASIEALVALTVSPRRVHDGVCTQACGRVLVCGHYCGGVCHRAGKCPPCQKPCENTCVHSQCKKRCNEPCASCSEACQWLCPHVASSCPLPCGSPCIRLPCDRRCELHLECGHQCPGLCGEPCLPSSYCRECGDQATHSDDVVDMLMLTQLKDHDPDDSPLIKLRCGHAFTIETLDHLIKIDDFYDRVDGTNEWKCAKPLQRSDTNGLGSTLGCPSCRAPVIGGIQRYGRVLHFGQTRASELRFHQKVSSVVVKLSNRRLKLLGAFAEAGNNADEQRRVASWAIALSLESLRSLKLVSPTQELMMKETSWLRRLGLEEENLNLAAYREVTAKYSCLQLRLEFMEVVAIVFQLQAALEGADLEIVCLIKATEPLAHRTKSLVLNLQERYDLAIKHEQQLLQLCEETKSNVSKWKALVSGVRLRAFYHLALRGLVGGAEDSDGIRAAVTLSKDELMQSYKNLQKVPACRQQGHVVEVDQLQELVDRCMRPAVFYDAVSTAERQAILGAFDTTEATRGVFGGFGGRWYECPNGHPYVVTECGGVMQQSTCPECGAHIGGEDHSLRPDNRDATQYFRGAL